MSRSLVSLLLPLFLAACGSEPAALPPGGTGAEPPAPAGPPLYEVSATVLEDRSHGPMLCLGALLASLPPQCGDVPLANWNWGEVEGEERLSGTIMGGYHLIGRYDGDTFRVTEVGSYTRRSRPAEPADHDFASPCPEPAEGWRALDHATQGNDGAVHAYARSQPDFVASWVTHLEPEKLEFGPVLVNVIFTDGSERHEAELRKIWDGPLCVVERDVPSARELGQVRREVEGSLDELGIQMLWSSGPDIEPVVQIGVVADPDGEAQASLDDRYGQGVVRLFPALRPVS